MTDAITAPVKVNTTGKCKILESNTKRNPKGR